MLPFRMRLVTAACAALCMEIHRTAIDARSRALMASLSKEPT